METQGFQTKMGHKMGIYTVICLLLSFLSTTDVLAQPLSDPQDHAARSFITALLDKDYTHALSLLEPEGQKAMTVEEIQKVGKALEELVAQYGKEMLLFMKGFRTYQNGKTLSMYTYKFKSDVTKGIAAVLIDVAFKNAQSVAIMGFLPKYAASPNSTQISTSPGQEVSLEKEQEWLVGNKTIQVNEIALVLDDRLALFAIKVMDDSASTITEQQAKAKAIPIVKYAIAHGYLQKAEVGASQSKRQLLEAIGVAFIKPGTRGGYRVQILPGEYKY
ncbi:hypothetical protein [Spirosoma sp. KNUC1025]|uniref:hypothetical protein n=1 Tax=Spirosoma sp. KNUC1025 TaxID=2894082 RepID=UPI003865550F|nr:hypothetical protein LN737_26770 [Spirosoma sp. KNUC1025]